MKLGTRYGIRSRSLWTRFPRQSWRAKSRAKTVPSRTEIRAPKPPEKRVTCKALAKGGDCASSRKPARSAWKNRAAIGPRNATAQARSARRVMLFQNELGEPVLDFLGMRRDFAEIGRRPL